MVTPGVPAGTRNRVMLVFSDSFGLVMAHTRLYEVMSAPLLVIKAFSPLMDHLSPFTFSARDLNPAVQEPACGSVPAMEPIALPATISGRYFSFSSGLKGLQRQAGGHRHHG